MTKKKGRQDNLYKKYNFYVEMNNNLSFVNLAYKNECCTQICYHVASNKRGLYVV